jgi:hypothetical protein
MTLKLSQVVVASLACAAFSMVMAQDPPALLRIYREDIKPGKEAAHEKTEMAFVRAISKTKHAHYTALESITGPTHALFLEGDDSYAALEETLAVGEKEPMKSLLEQLDAQDGELRSGERSLIAVYLKELSYLPEQANLAKCRFYSIGTSLVKPGHTDDFENMIKLLQASYEKMGSPRARMTYAVVSGAPNRTYLTIIGMESLKSMDPPLPVRNMREAMGVEDWARYQKFLADAVISTEYILYEVNPKMSYPSKEFIDADPDFWAPKPKPAPAAKPGLQK